MTSSTQSKTSTSTTPSRWRRPADLLAAAGLAGLGLAFALWRWPGVYPFGSDNDEYRLLASSLWRDLSPEIAGVEGTKYPFGYSLLIGAFDAIGLDMSPVAMLVNLAGIAVAAGLVYVLGRRFGVVPAAAGAAFFLLSPTLWDSAYLAMPDVVFVAAIATVLWRAGILTTPRDVGWLTAAVVAAALLKSVGLLAALAASVAVFARPDLRRWSWVPGSCGLAVTALQAAAVAPFAEHTTGYARTFWLVDPYNAALGEIGPRDLPRRVIERFDLQLEDVRVALFGDQWATGWLVVLALIAIALAVASMPERLAFSAPFIVIYMVFLSAWPFSSPRFGLVMLPFAAVGIAAAVGWASRAGLAWPAGALAAALLFGYAGESADEVKADRDRHEVEFGSLEAAVEEAGRWIEANVPLDDALASFDYRELAYRTGRTYLPLGYTSDVEELWADSVGRGARWIVVIRDLYHNRTVRVVPFIDAMAPRLETAADFGRVVIYQVRPEAMAAQPRA